MSLDDDVDRLYQLPLTEFTPARNDLAKRAGGRAAEIRKLAKPPVAAWAVNQLYWKDRKTHDALIEAANALRQAHTAVLSGKKGDLRFTGKEHEEALERAIKSTLSLLADAGQPVTDPTRHAIAQTLRALPSDDPPGRLSRTLAPGGFEMLAGITVKGGTERARAASRPAPAKEPAARAPADDRALVRAREDAADAARALRDAEQEARRSEFEAARTARATARADEALDAARAAFEAARTGLQEAEQASKEAARAHDRAQRAVETAARAVEEARRRAAAAEKTLAKRSP